MNDTMKKITKSICLVLISIIMISSLPLLGQEKVITERKRGNREEQMAKMKSMKIAFITENMELTTSEAEKFWPVYNEYEQKREAVTKELMERFKKTEEAPKVMSDEEADLAIRTHFNQEQALLDLKMEYYEKYLEVLPASRIQKLYEVENNFRRHLMGRLNHDDDPPADRRQGRAPEGKGVAPPCKERGHRR